MGTYRTLTKVPAPSLTAQVAESGDQAAGLHVRRSAELLEPSVAKVVEQRRGEDRYVVCLESVELFVAEVLTDAGRAGLDVSRAARILWAFSHRFSWVESRSRLRRSAQRHLDVEQVPATDRVYLDLRIAAGGPCRCRARPVRGRRASRTGPGSAAPARRRRRLREPFRGGAVGPLRPRPRPGD
ncbi:hypothetical protein D9V37_18225 [Nocardioides mangrovicus]|uniref:Uncharacterized protein n=1 Tax=Nocardioides mangrovicus TaxID=2478913 RepID=A0A3L8NZQ2_9ACTN|nr:hypothetical protein [Nocardioides mangrovicus]RLV48033.1 hypothetical protein D9V37_18225 [Nocardioides mangrovicus]